MNRKRNPAQWLSLGAWWLGALSPLSVAAAGVEAGIGSAGPVSYHAQVRPVLQANCQGCHQPAKAKGGYVMTDFERLLAPGDSGDSPIIGGDPDGSFLVQQITPREGEAEMPRGKPPLHQLEIELIRRWIAEGAVDDTPVNLRRRYDTAHPPVYSRPPVITSIDVSPDGLLLAVAGYHEILLQRTDGLGLAGRLIGLSERIQSVRFSPDGKLLAAAGGQPARMGEIQVWDVETGALRLSVPVGFDTVYGVNWSPDGTLVSFGLPDKTVRVLEAKSGRQVLQQMAHEDWVLGTVFSTQGTHVISVGRDMTAKLSEVATQRFVDNLTSITPGALRGGLLSVARHPTRDEVLVGGSDGVPQIYEVFRTAARKIGDNAALLRKFPAMEGRIFSVDFRPDGKMIAAAASLDGRAQIQLFDSDYDSRIPDVLLKAYEKTSGGYSAEEREAIQAFTTDGVRLAHAIEVPAAVYAVRFSPDGKRLWAGTSDGRILSINTDAGGLDLEFATAPGGGETPGHGRLATEAAMAAGAPAEAAADPIPEGAAVVRLVIEPEQVRLANRNEQVQLLVTAQLSTGDAVDVTRHAKFEVNADLGVVSARGRLTAIKAGRGRITAEYGGHAAEAELDLSAFVPEYRADFVRDVNPALSRLGCNTGTCHGSKEGKNGFKLSLRGYDPVFDVRSFVDDLAARRVNPAAPDESLMLLKATAGVPHEGGQRTTTDSDYYAILRRWIAEGARLDPESPRVAQIEIFPRNPVVQRVGAPQQLRIVATYVDGRRRDVTAEAFVTTGNADVAVVDETGLITTLRRGEAPILARYEGSYAATTLTVMGDRTGFQWADQPANNRIDELVAAKWQRMKILPSALCRDDEFMRRVSLDLTGLPPTPDQLREFMANPRDPRSKRDALIERLLNSPEFVDHWTSKWADLLQVNRKFLGVEGAALFRDWIHEQVERNRPYDEFVQEILTASGSNKDVPAASYWKILREPTEAMENTTHLFLATRFNCNKCHDHPFERWTQDQYYSLAQYFAQVDLEKDPASGDRKIGGTAVEDARPLFEIVSDQSEGAVSHERTGEVVPAGFPYPAEPEARGEGDSRRAELAAWITTPRNRYFAVSYVNRLWGYLLGVGLIEPLDDIRAGNPPTNPELLEHLTREFVESGFDSKHILRQICQSRTYQLSLATHPWNQDDQINYSHALPRRLPAEVLLDAVYAVTGSTPDFPGAEPGLRAAQLLDSAVDVPGGFLATLGRPPRESACECERSNDIKLSSVMSLLSGPAVSEAVSDPENALPRLVRQEPDDRELTDALFLRVLSRHATETELESVERYIEALEVEDSRLRDALTAAEAAWAREQTRLEAQRRAAMAKAEQALAEQLLAQAPARARAQRARLERIADAEGAVAAYLPRLESGVAAWEAELSAGQRSTGWEPLSIQSVSASGSARLRKLADGSVLSTPSVGELPNYTVVGETRLAQITGIKIEALPHAELPNFGPGHAGGDFVISELDIDVASLAAPEKFDRLKIQSGGTDMRIEGRAIEQLWNGRSEQGWLEGWSAGGPAGRPHWAAFAFESPVGDTNGSLVRVTLQHRYEAPYEIGRFRIWVTTGEAAAAEGLPQPIRAIVGVSPGKRTADQAARLREHYRTRDPEMLRLDFAVALARQPLPEDDVLRDLEIELTRAAKAVAADSRLVQLREDAESSRRQLGAKRLTAAQDLTWALINTPAFLFNR